MMPNLIQIEIFKCFLVTCGRLNSLQHEKRDEGMSFIWGREARAPSLSVSRPTMLTPTSSQTGFHARPLWQTCWEMPEPCIKSSTHRDNGGFKDWDDGSLALLYFLIRISICSFIVQKRRWRPSTPTLQPFNPLSAVAATLAQRLPWLAQQHTTYARKHAHSWHQLSGLPEPDRDAHKWWHLHTGLHTLTFPCQKNQCALFLPPPSLHSTLLCRGGQGPWGWEE